ncbi:MAG: Holliday junction branch migration protein RuvA [Thermoanaerobacteraceae bacterium]|nr:Holliday junction branch migration protein RuvA [Thermoanaerobacteraceae bacterium]
MVEYIKGRLKGFNDSTAVLEVGGFGLAVRVSNNTIDRLPSLDEEAFLYIYAEIRENDITLYGFADEEERWAFLDLISVNGVGPKIALNILSRYNYEELYMYISSKNTAALESIPGVGKKTASRIITELEDKARKRPQAVVTANRDIEEEAIAALMGLGYTRIEAASAVGRVSGSSVEAVLVEALKILGR